MTQRAAGKPDLLARGEINLALFMKGDLGKHATENHNIKLTIKYLDPRQMIRATAPNSIDVDRCHRLAYCACHSAMSGWTDFSVGHVRNQTVMIPLDVLTSLETRRLRRRDTDWQRLILSTGQSNFLGPENYTKVISWEKQEHHRAMRKYKEMKLKIFLD